MPDVLPAAMVHPTRSAPVSSDPSEAAPIDVAASIDVPAAFAEHGSFLLRVVERMTGDAALAEDVVQEAFLVLHRRRQEVEPGALGGWLYRVAINVLRHHRRASTRRAAAIDRLDRHTEQGAPAAGGAGAAAVLPPDLLASRENVERIREAVAALPPVRREVFVLFELEGQSGAEIASLLDIPVGTVWTRLHAARREFRAALAQRGPVP